MKTIYNLLLATLIFFSFNHPVFAQSNKNEINAGLGILTTTEIAGIFSDLVTTALTAGAY